MPWEALATRHAHQSFERLAEAGFSCPAVVHPRRLWNKCGAVGRFKFPITCRRRSSHGYGAIVNTGAIVSHDCQVGDYANLSPGAILAGEVQVGPAALVGMAATVNLRTCIGRGARIGNGATVKSDLPEGGVVRAGSTWPQ
jgi:acetyltransferase-like isoleucine patch superfamily enzyme